jgi:hypothetical protein
VPIFNMKKIFMKFGPKILQIKKSDFGGFVNVEARKV